MYAVSYDFWKTFKRLDIDHHSVIFLQGQGLDYFFHQYYAYQKYVDITTGRQGAVVKAWYFFHIIHTVDNAKKE